MTDPTRAGERVGFVDPLERVQAYRLARAVAEVARADADRMRKDPVLRDVAGQLLRAAGSIGANIAEGYVRSTVADRRRFYEYALGSARECEVWYDSAGLPINAEQTERLISVRRLLLTMIKNARENSARLRR